MNQYNKNEINALKKRIEFEDQLRIFFPVGVVVIELEDDPTETNRSSSEEGAD